jgi:hypothetical protein
VTPATARAFLLHLLLAWLGVLAVRLAWGGGRRLRGGGPSLRGVLELAGGLAALGWLGWVLG